VGLKEGSFIVYKRENIKDITRERLHLGSETSGNAYSSTTGYSRQSLLDTALGNPFNSRDYSGSTNTYINSSTTENYEWHFDIFTDFYENPKVSFVVPDSPSVENAIGNIYAILKPSPYQEVKNSVPQKKKYKESSIADDGDDHFEMALIHLDKGEVEKALVDLNAAIKIASREDEYYIIRGGIYFDKNEYRLAIDDYTSAIEINPENADYFFKRGFASFRLGKKNKSEEDYNHAVDIDSRFKKLNYENFDQKTYNGIMKETLLENASLLENKLKNM
jgi:tetratricopeptide (TPR) repeat protein